MLTGRIRVGNLGSVLLTVSLFMAASSHAQQTAPASTSDTTPAQAGLKLQGEKPQPVVREAAFPESGSITFQMNIGDLRILPAGEGTQKLRLELEPRHGDDDTEAASWVREFSVAGAQAKIVVRMPKVNKHSESATLYVPKNTNLKVHLEIGDMTVGQIAGDKDLQLGIGDLKVQAVPHAEYRSVQASAGIGDVNDGVFHRNQGGWLGKHENAEFGDGAYRLRLHVTIGDVTIEPGEQRQAQR